METNLPTVTKNMKRRIVKWSVNHPDGHTYVMPSLEPLFDRFGLTKAELKARGWKFKPHYE